MTMLQAYSLRMERRMRRLRSARKSRELSLVADRRATVARGDILLFATLRDERIRLPYFLQYYRDLGIDHFFMVDNGSSDGSDSYLAAQEDVTLWRTEGSYKKSRFGVDWLNYLRNRNASGHWVLTVDVDEFLVYAHSDTRPLRALTDWLDTCQLRAFGTLLLDMYPRGRVSETVYREGDNPFAQLRYFDSGNYLYRRNPRYQNLWCQGGPRQRAFFADAPEMAPALNKVPLVRWSRGMTYVSSTHMLLPRGLNRVYDEWGGEKPTGCLLHAKFLNILNDKSVEELERRQHYAASREYRAYLRQDGLGRSLWTEESSTYKGWRQLEEMGLMSAGGWV
ncbi:glycosyltransferase family 2 protein [Oceanomicrobium pacificus]|uniref:Glycosyltransferase family 2 protein n=1 Tax=Oceanomicrobium pacificus TaxID=2692916 RepID=A0A6B0TSH8_9RHOB|nr:glycosyltransferase family 2 protein [Oceanomicrobium pacificus]MXU64688.1 glycosyltransferase family 2 protein [Oceanomicrobium pacificus]